MKEYDFIQMVQRIKNLPDELLIQILRTATSELLRRTQHELRRLKELTQKP